MNEIFVLIWFVYNKHPQKKIRKEQKLKIFLIGLTLSNILIFSKKESVKGAGLSNSRKYTKEKIQQKLFCKKINSVVLCKCQVKRNML